MHFYLVKMHANYTIKASINYEPITNILIYDYVQSESLSIATDCQDILVFRQSVQALQYYS